MFFILIFSIIALLKTEILKKFWNIAVVMIFINFMALPSIAAVFGIDLPQTNVVISEEENHTSSVSVFEKTIPRTLQVHDFLRFFESADRKMAFEATDDDASKDPLHTIFSPPPEV